MPDDNEKKYSLAELAAMVSTAQSPTGQVRAGQGQTDPTLAAAAQGPNLAEELLTLKAELAALKTGKAEAARSPATPAQGPAPSLHPAPAGSTNPTIPGATMMDHSPSQARAYLGSIGYNHKRPHTPESRAAAHSIRKKFEAELDNMVVTEVGERRR